MERTKAKRNGIKIIIPYVFNYKAKWQNGHTYFPPRFVKVSVAQNDNV